jgi:hypothetical protein
MYFFCGRGGGDGGGGGANVNIIIGLVFLYICTFFTLFGLGSDYFSTDVAALCGYICFSGRVS